MTVMTSRGLSQRAAAGDLGLSRSVEHYARKQPGTDAKLSGRSRDLSQQFPRFGYRRIATWLHVGDKRLWRLWSRMGLALPRRRPCRRRSGSDIRLPTAMLPHTVCSYDFVHDRTANKRTLKRLWVRDECPRACLGMEVARSMRSQDVILTLCRLMRLYGKPAYLRSDNGAAFTAVMRWLQDQHVGPAFIAPGSPWQHGTVERFNGKRRDACLNREWFVSVPDARVLIEQWRRFYNHQRPHSALGYRPPAVIRKELTLSDKLTGLTIELTTN
jgi:transposase InsO family protein